MIFSPIYRAFCEAALSHAIYGMDECGQFTKGRFNVLEKGLSHENYES